MSVSMKLMATLIAALGLGGCVIADVTEVAQPAPGAIQRQYASPTAFYAKHIIIPPGYATIRLPGIVADTLPGGAYGDTEQQAESIFTKIAAALRQAGASEADVVAMTVYLVKPPAAAGMDFDGMMRAYGRHYGSATQPNRPVRSTVEVAGLVRPGMLVEIEVTAAISARPAAR
jgi:enamine deaminase RidA (YjgF/YER057c/UK114 family)